MKINDPQYRALKNIIVSFIDIDVNNGKKLEFGNIGSYVNKATQFSGLTVDKDCYDSLISDMEYQFKVFHTPGCCIYDDYDDPHSWYNNSTDAEQNYFWLRYNASSG